jgi:Protein of unknown function (DUF1579)
MMDCGVKQLGVPESAEPRHPPNLFVEAASETERKIMTNPLSALLLLPLAVSIAVAHSSSQSTPPNPCTAVGQKQFDFWIGEWELTWPGAKAGEIARGTNNVKRILDGCVVQENFSGQDAMHLRGTSVSIFDTNAGRWKQTWVDNEGGYLDFVGEFKDGQMILQREAIGTDGTKSVQRMVWKNITANELDWSWEASRDGGKTWQVNWPIHYKRKN